MSRLHRRSPKSRWTAMALALTLIVISGGVAHAAGGSKHRRPKPPGPVPQGFVGVDADGPLLTPGSTMNLDAQLRAMVANGVQSLRVAFSWAAAQPYATAADVPAAESSQYTDIGGVPTDFAAPDAIVAAAARRRLSILPTVLYAPSWDARRNTNPRGGIPQPRSDGAYAAYLAALIGRYGPRGSFWAQNPSIPRMPIREWQIWNEPDVPAFWNPPFARTYVALLRAAHAAIKRADPGAKVVLGALTGYAWSGLRQVYRIRGARRFFDVVSVDAYTKRPANVIRFLQFVRGVMDQHGDRAKPLLATELSWPSSVGQGQVNYDFDTTPAGQARNLAMLLPLLNRNRAALGLAGFDWYTWIGAESRGASDFNFSGLLKVEDGVVTAKPALAVFSRDALALEGCRAKGAVATSCIR
jgi:polysaccharide biosynthesis protein PslG